MPLYRTSADRRSGRAVIPPGEVDRVIPQGEALSGPAFTAPWLASAQGQQVPTLAPLVGDDMQGRRDSSTDSPEFLGLARAT
jgi:hypothetical protein